VKTRHKRRRLPPFLPSEDRVGLRDTSLLAGDSVFLTEANAERLAVALCRMRGAALKLGQMLSIQDESVVPPAIAKALERVREGADVMPASQLMEAIELHLGKNWRAPNGSIKDGGNVEVIAFSNEPLAAASIGQVHRATVRRLVRDANSGEKENTFEDVEVCMKIQYPGVARSIHSDIDNLVRLVRMTDLLPRGLYVEHAVATAKEELTLECDYEYELRSQEKMRALLEGDPAWTAPRDGYRVVLARRVDHGVRAGHRHRQGGFFVSVRTGLRRDATASDNASRAVRVSVHAVRPELRQFPVLPAVAFVDDDRFRRREGVPETVRGRVP
jgi:aarF domain-containing kinase